MTSALYRGTLVHARRDDVRRTFSYPVFMSAIDLEAPPPSTRLFSRDRANLFSLHQADYRTPLTSGVLLTNLRIAGYTFNPVSFFLRYEGNALRSVIAEVNNTYGGRHCYELDDRARLPDRGAHAVFRTPRSFFVSPFLHGPRSYEWRFPHRRDPRDLAIAVHVDTPAGDRIFTATLSATRAPFTDRALLAAALRYPLMTAQVIGLIHYEALKLRYLHGVPYRRPGPEHRPLDLQ